MKRKSLRKKLKQLKNKLTIKWVLSTQFPGIPLYNPQKRSHNPIARYKYTTADQKYIFYIIEVKTYKDGAILFWGYEIDTPANRIRDKFTTLPLNAVQDMHLIRQQFTPTRILSISEIGRPWISVKDDEKRDWKRIEYWNNVFPPGTIPEPKGKELDNVEEYYEYLAGKLNRTALASILKN